jgi:hypothetical protein
MACRGIVKVAARSPSLAAGRTGARNGPACVGCINRWAQANLRKLLRPDTPTQLALVDVTGARRLARSFPEAVALGRLRRRIELSN